MSGYLSSIDSVSSGEKRRLFIGRALVPEGKRKRKNEQMKERQATGLVGRKRTGSGWAKQMLNCAWLGRYTLSDTLSSTK